MTAATLVERVARALVVTAMEVGGFELDAPESQVMARAAIEALGLTEVLPLTHREFVKRHEGCLGRPSVFDVERYEDAIWPKPDRNYRVFVMADDAALKGEG